MVVIAVCVIACSDEAIARTADRGIGDIVEGGLDDGLAVSVFYQARFLEKLFGGNDWWRIYLWPT